MKQLNSYLSETIRKRFVQPFSCFVDNHNKILLRTLVALVFVFSVSFSLSSQALEMVEGKYEVIDTGVQNTELFGPHTVGFWLNNHKLLINTFSDEKDAQIKKLGKVILFDTKRKQFTTIFETGNIFCGNAPTKIFRVRDYTTGTDTFFKIDESGKTSQVEAPSGWEPYQCRVFENRKKDRLQAYLNESEGYIDQGKTGNGGREKAILYLTGKPQIELPLTGHDIDYMVYLPFKNQYLLNNFDFISGRLQPSGEPFYNYMSPDGTLTRVPQPEEFLKFAGQLGDMYPMRDGMIIDNTGYMRKNSGLYYLKDDKAIRIYGAPPLISAPPLVMAPFTKFHLVSPDGCSIAFVSYLSYKQEAKKTVKIINVCEEK